jgi:hypothetical protein
MNTISTYLISASLILLVIRQIREHPLDARSLAVPVLAVGAAAVMFLHSVPVGAATWRWRRRAWRSAPPWALSAA